MIFCCFAFALLPFPPVHPIPAEPAPTSITLSVSANPVLLGQPVTLDASVQPTDATGLVTFYSGVSPIGIAPALSGQASFATSLLPAGANAITARFDSSASLSTSVSAPLTLRVGVSPGTGFAGGAIYNVGLAPAYVAAADFNNDGIADLVIANAGDGTISAFLGNGDGSFNPLPPMPTGTDPLAIAAADFNGDGIGDLAVVNSGDPSVVILLGNGDGTFQALAPISLGSNLVSAAAADFNGDGVVDLAVVDANNDTLAILTGNGDGTFIVGFPVALGLSPMQVVAADFNGDGNPDLAVAGSNPDGVALLLGNGDGTFVSRPLLSAGTGPSSLAAADFNGDGKTDLAVGDFGDLSSFNGGGIEILLGNGDGSFKAPSTAASGPNVTALVAGDIDGDGKLDVAIISLDGFSTYLGNGDGTLQSPQSYSAGASPDAFAVGSFDGTGLTEFAVVNHNEGQLDVLTGSLGTCQFSIFPTSLLYDATSVSAATTLSANATGCAWQASSDNWIVPQPPSGLGGSSVAYQILANNTGYDRTGTLVIGGQTVTIAQRSTAQQFADVPVTGYNFDAVNLLKNTNITAGCGPDLYCPNEQVTRAQMAIFIVRGIYGSNSFTWSPQPYFTDVPPSAFGFEWIQKMFELGITTGCGSGIYCPNAPVTRAQMAVFIIRARFGSTASFSWPATPYFTDVPSGAFAFAWIQRMRLEGITTGCGPALYCPAGSVIRGDMAIFLMRGLFDELYAAGTPALASVSPSILVRGQPGTFTLTGSGTNFVQGQTTVSTIPHITVTNVQVSSATSLTVDLDADQSAPTQPVGLVAITGSEQDVLPNQLIIQ